MNARTAYALTPAAFGFGFFNAMALTEGPDAARAAAYSLLWDVATWPVSAQGEAVVNVALAVMAGIVVTLGAGTVFFRALDSYGPRVMRAVGRHAFRVARAAYRAAR